jgi:molybdopterin molybdotransferase
LFSHAGKYAANADRHSMTFPAQFHAEVKAEWRPVPFDDAARIIANCARPLDAEQVRLEHAAQRSLAEDIIADCDVPAATVSAMDGYAVRNRDLQHLPASLPIAGTSFAGAAFDKALPEGFCVRVFTGATVPSGTDRVIIQEIVREEGGRAYFRQPPSGRPHLRAPGSDFAKGDVILPCGTHLTPQAMIGAAAADRALLSVYRKPRVTILCCGDELTPPGKPGREPEKIPESISYGVSPLVQQWGGTVAGRHRISDNLVRLRQAAEAALASSDITVVIAGASVGDKDFAKAAFADPHFEILFGKVAIKPGKPVWFGRRDKCLVLGLPGNPSSAMVTARLFLAPLVAGLAGRRVEEAWDWQAMRNGSAIGGDAERDIFHRARIDGTVLRAVTNQDSASQRSLALATYLIRSRAGELCLSADTSVEALKL